MAAVLVMLDQECQVKAGGRAGRAPEPPPVPAHLTLADRWNLSLEERQSIFEHKWFMSERAGCDVGVETVWRQLSFCGGKIIVVDRSSPPSATGSRTTRPSDPKPIALPPPPDPLLANSPLCQRFKMERKTRLKNQW